MPAKPSQARLYEELADRYGQMVADAFFRAIDNLKTLAQVQRVTSAIEAGDIEGALDALNLDPAAFDEMLDRIREGYSQGGRTAADELPKRRPDGSALVFRFDGRNPRAERWLSREAASLITRITDDQRQAVREVLRQAMSEGINPRAISLRLVGVMDPRTRRRVGGVIGLTSAQERAVAKARQELESGDPAQLRAYLNRDRRDGTFDRSVRKAIRDETPIPASTIAKAIVGYERRLLELRGTTIGRTEAMRAIHEAQHEMLRQAVDSGQVQANAIRRVWRSAGDLRVRHSHMVMNSDTVGLAESFRTPSGARMMFPGDTSLGAPASETINCRCVVEARIDFLANIR